MAIRCLPLLVLTTVLAGAVETFIANEIDRRLDRIEAMANPTTDSDAARRLALIGIHQEVEQLRRLWQGRTDAETLTAYITDQIRIAHKAQIDALQLGDDQRATTLARRIADLERLRSLSAGEQQAP